MKVFLLACAGALVIAIVAAGVLDTVQKPSDEAFATTGARL